MDSLPWIRSNTLIRSPSVVYQRIGPIREAPPVYRASWGRGQAGLEKCGQRATKGRMETIQLESILVNKTGYIAQICEASWSQKVKFPPAPLIWLPPASHHKEGTGIDQITWRMEKKIEGHSLHGNREIAAEWAAEAWAPRASWQTFPIVLFQLWKMGRLFCCWPCQKSRGGVKIDRQVMVRSCRDYRFRSRFRSANRKIGHPCCIDWCKERGVAVGGIWADVLIQGGGLSAK